jgi:hypothetical protein
MRTTLDLPEDLREEARRVLGFKSKTDTIVCCSTTRAVPMRSAPLARNFFASEPICATSQLRVARTRRGPRSVAHRTSMIHG